jgi:predicted N-acetyltransferase YhbS
VRLAVARVAQGAGVAAFGAQLKEEATGALRQVGCQGVVVRGGQVLSSASEALGN